MKRLVIEEMGRRRGLSQADAGRAVDAVFEAVDGVLTQGSNVSIPGFGTFRREIRADRTARNPRTGETVRVSAKSVTKFREPRKR
jgi:DNA-binding protein HU-beta